MKEKRKIYAYADFAVAVFMILFSLLLLQQITGIRIKESRILPFFAFALCAISGAAMLIQSIRHQDLNKPLKKLFLAKKEVVVFVLLLICWALIDILGFYVSISLFLIPVSLLLESEINKETVVKAIAVDAVLAIIIYIGFAVLFKMSTPRGMFF